MSLFGMMRTGTSGMNAQASRLSTVADNIANSSTTGYKKASTEFSSLILPSVGGNYNSGGVQTSIRYDISTPGSLEYTNSKTDLALDGDGFFIVQSNTGTPYLTRAGSFQLDSDGNLVNSAGYTAMGYDFAAGIPTPVVNGYGGLVPINVGTASLVAAASENGYFVGNLDSRRAAITGTAPSDTTTLPLGTREFTHKSSLVATDDLGNPVTFDFYYTKTAANQWEVTVFNQADATGGGPFPYTGASGFTPVTSTLEFDPTTGELAATSPDTDITFTVPGGKSLVVDLADMTQVGYDFTVQTASVDGSQPSLVESFEVSEEGIVFAKYKNGNLDPLYRLALATVQSPDKLTPVSGNVYQQGIDSGVITTGFAGTGSFGRVVSGALEGSNVDIAAELTTMIQSQRTYTANSKVFQTGSELMDVLVNLAR